ncbi:MAG: hypothetical protein LBB98_06540 [Treponema sp.]|nr:hypothetical protein [Treponema sp.]
MSPITSAVHDGGKRNDTVFVHPAEIRNVSGRFFFGTEKVAVLEPMAEGQAGPDKKSPGGLLFDMRGNQYRFMLEKSKLR